MLLVAFKEELRVRVGCRYIDSVDRGRSPGRDIQRSLRIEDQIPNVSGLIRRLRLARIAGQGCGVEDHRGGALVQTGLAWLDAVDFARRVALPHTPSRRGQLEPSAR